jgi:hypothetical protein
MTLQIVVSGPTADTICDGSTPEADPAPVPVCGQINPADPSAPFDGVGSCLVGGALKITEQLLSDYYVTQPYMEKGFQLITKSFPMEPVPPPPLRSTPPPPPPPPDTVCMHLTEVELQELMAFGDPLHWVVWLVLFAMVVLAGFLLMLIEGYGDNESLPLHPWGLAMDCMWVITDFRMQMSFAFCAPLARCDGRLQLTKSCDGQVLVADAAARRGRQAARD